MKNFGSFGTIGLIVALALSLFAVFPNFGAAQAPPGTTTTTTTKADIAATPVPTPLTAVEPTSLGSPAFPTIPFNVFYGPGQVATTNTKTITTTNNDGVKVETVATITNDVPTSGSGLVKGTFADCIEKQFGLRLQLLPATTQAHILKNYSLYVGDGKTCPAYPDKPLPVKTSVYFTTIIVGILAIISFFAIFKHTRGFLQEHIILPQSNITVSKEEVAAVVEAVSKKLDEKKHTLDEFAHALGEGIGHLNREKQYISKFSVSRFIALVGTYVIIVTFAFAAEYGFWALFYFGDNSAFENITRTILIGGAAAFAPYITNKITEAITKGGAKTDTP